MAEIWQDGRRVACSATPFVPSKHLELRDPGLTVQTRVEGDTLVVQVSALSMARFVEFAIDSADVVFSDNYFDLLAGAGVVVTCPLPAHWTADRRVVVRALVDSSG